MNTEKRKWTDEITLSFRTLQRNGLLLHTGKSADYVNLSLKSGAVCLVINLGSGAFEALVEPSDGKFNDNAWHAVRVSRNLRQVVFSRGLSCCLLRTVLVFILHFEHIFTILFFYVLSCRLVIVYQWSPTLFLEICYPAEFSFNPSPLHLIQIQLMAAFRNPF